MHHVATLPVQLCATLDGRVVPDRRVVGQLHGARRHSRVRTAAKEQAATVKSSGVPGDGRVCDGDGTPRQHRDAAARALWARRVVVQHDGVGDHDRRVVRPLPVRAVLHRRAVELPDDQAVFGGADGDAGATQACADATTNVDKSWAEPTKRASE